MCSAPDVTHFAPGQIIGEYRILETIGDGGFSLVYKAEDLNLNRLVAIKQLRPEAFCEEGSREWFVREAQLTASLNHPNIVHIYSLREQGDSLLLVMEYLPGDLHTTMREYGPLDRATLLKVAADICRALETLHERSVIHRDIKPENILIGQANQFKLADFGLAHVRPGQQLSLDDGSGPQPGTLLYMSPEQALGLHVVPQSDIYSLAVVLYEAITGHYYLEFNEFRQNEDELRAMIVHTSPRPLAGLHPTVPPEIGEALLRALSKDPADRPPTARAFLADLKTAIARGKHSTLSQKYRLIEAKPPVVSPELERELYRVRTLRDAEHQPNQAMEHMRIIWQVHPGVAEVAAEWGETMLAVGRIQEGRTWLETAVRLKPELPFAQLALAELYRDEDDNDESADDAIVQAIHADADLVFAVLLEDIEAALKEPQKFQEYIELFRRAATERVTACVLHNLGQILALHPARVAESIATFEEAIRLAPDYGPAHVGLGSLLVHLNRPEPAISLLEQGAYGWFPSLLPGNWHKIHTVYQRPHAFLALALLYAELGQVESSAVAARSVLDLDHRALEGDAFSLLNTYLHTAQDWIKHGDALRAYKFLNQIVPLAAQWGFVPIFTLFESIQDQISAADRRPGQWEAALDWLKAGLSNLQPPTSPHGAAQEVLG